MCISTLSGHTKSFGNENYWCTHWEETENIGVLGGHEANIVYAPEVIRSNIRCTNKMYMVVPGGPTRAEG